MRAISHSFPRILANAATGRCLILDRAQYIHGNSRMGGEEVNRQNTVLRYGTASGRLPRAPVPRASSADAGRGGRDAPDGA